MKIVILGSGIIGLTSAYYFAEEGHDITIIDRQSDVAMETSYKNGGQLSVSYAEPWASIPNLINIISWVGKSDSPLLFKPSLNYQQIKWGINFIKECTPSKTLKNTETLIKMATNSVNEIIRISEKHQFNYHLKQNGILCVYTSEKDFIKAQNNIKSANKFGINRTNLSKNDLIAKEPSLKNSTLNIVGGDFTECDAIGDAHLFCQELKNYLTKKGVKFIFDAHIQNINTDSISYLSSKDTKINDIQYDKTIVALGSWSYQFLEKHNISSLIYPTKGYSATFNITDSTLINKISITDSSRKTVITPLGDKLRVAGTAEFNGYNLQLNKDRCDLLLKITKDFFPKGVDLENPSYWCGLRPSTPSNIPIISKTKLPNVYINAGHGTLGWTLCMDSAKSIYNLISQEKNA